MTLVHSRLDNQESNSSLMDQIPHEEAELHQQVLEQICRGELRKVLAAHGATYHKQELASLAEELICFDCCLAVYLTGEVIAIPGQTFDGELLNKRFKRLRKSEYGQSLTDLLLVIDELLANNPSPGAHVISNYARRVARMHDRNLEAAINLIQALCAFFHTQFSFADVYARKVIQSQSPYAKGLLSDWAHLLLYVIDSESLDSNEKENFLVPTRQVIQVLEGKTPRKNERLSFVAATMFATLKVGMREQEFEELHLWKSWKQRIEAVEKKWACRQNEEQFKHRIKFEDPYQNLQAIKLSERSTRIYNDMRQRKVAPFTLHIMGHLWLQENERQVALDLQNKRHAYELLYLLSIKENHELNKVDLLNLIWPSRSVNVNSLYQACSYIRSVLKGFADDELIRHAVQVHKGRETISLNTSVIEIDVDIIRAIAQEIKKSKDSSLIIALSRMLCSYYEGLPCYVPLQNMVLMHNVREKLRNIIFEALNKGMQSALIKEYFVDTLAFSEVILELEPSNETAILTHISALHRLGRTYEAQNKYYQYMKYLTRQGKREPLFVTNNMTRAALPRQNDDNVLLQDIYGHDFEFEHVRAKTWKSEDKGDRVLVEV